MSQPSEIRFVVETPPGYRPDYVTGAQGAPTPRGDVEINFFQDRHRLPQALTYSVDPGGKLGAVMKEERAPAAIVREVLCGVVMKLEDAKALAVLLQRMISQLEARPVPSAQPQVHVQ